MAKDQKAFDIFCKNTLFAHVTDHSHLWNLFNAATEIHLNPGEHLLYEGEYSTDIYFILDGTLEIMKSDKETKKSYLLATIHNGEIVGEMALLDGQPRSSSVRAYTPSHVLKISITDFQAYSEAYQGSYISFLEISKKIAQRLRHTNEVTAAAFKNLVDEYQMRVSMGTFLLSIVTMLCLFIFALNSIAWLQNYVLGGINNAKTTLYLAPSLGCIFLISVFIIIKHSHLPLNQFGLTFNNWKKSIAEAVLGSLAFCVFLVVAKWLIIHTIPYFKYTPLFIITDPTIHFTSSTLLAIIIYSIFTSPLQEFIARGCLQSSLQTFLTHKNKTITAILASNLMFSTVHIYISLQVSLLAFITGLFLGWLYSRGHSLIGPWIAHVLIGIWGFWIVGVF